MLFRSSVFDRLDFGNSKLPGVEVVPKKPLSVFDRLSFDRAPSPIMEKSMPFIANQRKNSYAQIVSKRNINKS